MGRQLPQELVPWMPQLPLEDLMVTTHNVASKAVVRITGGCANMSVADSHGVLDLFTGAFKGFSGLQLVGATRMIQNDDPAKVVFGITEVGPAIRDQNPDSMLVGVVPRTERLIPDWSRGFMKVEQIPSEDYVPSHGADHGELATIIHPSFDVVVLAMAKLTREEVWDDEVEFCRYVTDLLVRRGRWRSLLVAYNGGSVTEKEVRATAARGWPVLLVEGSGRKADELASDKEFLLQHPNVHVCARQIQSMRAALYELQVLKEKDL